MNIIYFSTKNLITKLIVSEIKDKFKNTKINTIIFKLNNNFDDEEFSFDFSNSSIIIEGSKSKSFFYATQTLIANQFKSLKKQSFKPLCKARGIKVYLPDPTPAGINDFKKLIDFIAYYRYNFIMIEIGGAMEFKKHPEINHGWIEYANFMNEYSGKAQKIQKSFDWNKNSIHTTNGNGKVVSQTIIKELTAYCKERFIEVIPEMPSLSHCDYLLVNHPELAERKDDPYPDTACPNHPNYYNLLFDLLDEIIDVFEPERINLGHDEYYSIALCERCKKINAANIFADDINKCNRFLKSKNLKLMIWGEKLLDAHFLDGYPLGGNALKVWHQLDNPNLTPPTKDAIKLIDKDIEILHWYWSIDRKLEQQYENSDFSYIFGNMHSDIFPDWRNRKLNKKLLGTCVSNWGSSDFITLQRNGILFEIVYGSILHWDSSYDDNKFDEAKECVFNDLYNANMMTAKTGTYLEITHKTDFYRDFQSYFDGIFVDEEKDFLGYHLFKNSSGKTIKVPVIYGTNIINQDLIFERGVLESEDQGIGSEDHAYDCFSINRSYLESSYTALPIKQGNISLFKFIYQVKDDISYEYIGFEKTNKNNSVVKLSDYKIIKIDKEKQH